MRHAWLPHGRHVAAGYHPGMSQPTDQPFSTPEGPAQAPSAQGAPGYASSTPAPPGQLQPYAEPAAPQSYAAYQQQQPAPAAYQQPQLGYQPPAQTQSTLYLVAAILNWVVLGITVISTLGLGIIAAAWMVPMTVMIHKGAKDGYKHTGLAVCTLLFCGIISGILMLVDEGNRQPKPLR